MGPRIGVEHHVFVDPFEVECVGQRLTDADILEALAPRN